MEEEKKDVTEDVKKETVETVKQVKESIKKVDLKNDTKETKGFITAMIKDPFEKLKEIATDEKNKYLKIAIILLVVWTLVVFIKAIWAKSWAWGFLMDNTLSIIKRTIAPILSVLVASFIVYFINKKETKSLVTIITSLTTAKIPVILSAIVGLLVMFSSSISKLTTPFSYFCSTISIILTYFAMKSLMGEEGNSKFLKKFVMIQAIYYVVYLVISFLEIYI